MVGRLNPRTIHAVLRLISALVLAGCTGQAPDSAVRGYYVALSQGDTGTMRSQLCLREREAFDRAGGSIAMGLLSQFSKPDVSGLRYTVREQTRDRALVDVLGDVGVEVLGIRSYVPIKGVVTVVTEGGAWKVCGGQ